MAKVKKQVSAPKRWFIPWPPPRTHRHEQRDRTIRAVRTARRVSHRLIATVTFQQHRRENVPALSREFVSPSSAQHRFAAGTTSFSTTRRRSRVVHMDDQAMAEPAWCGPGGSAGDHPAVASRWLQNLLALEIAK